MLANWVNFFINNAAHYIYIYYFLYLIVCYLIILFFIRFLPVAEGSAADKKDQVQMFLFFIFFASVIPVLGVIFSIYLIFYMRKLSRRSHGLELNAFDFPEFRIEKMNSTRGYGEGGALSILYNEKMSIDERLRSLLMLNKFKNKQIKKINRSLLSSDFDNLRLYAYVMHEKERKKSNEVIRMLALELKKTENPVVLSTLHGFLAEQYKNYLSLNTVHDELKNEINAKIIFHYSASITFFPENANRHFQLGLFYSENEQYENAITTLEAALTCEADHEPSLKKLSEIAFIQKNYAQMMRYMAMIKESSATIEIPNIKSHGCV